MGDSDHLGIVVTKYTRAPALKPRTVIKRSYKYFNIESFLTDILNSDINDAVCAHEDLEGAAEVFENKFKAIIDKHAPIKKNQMRNNYSPFVSESTKLLNQEK